jgi:hypothetical protein
LLESNIYFDSQVSVSHLSRYIYWGDASDGWDTYIYESSDDVLDFVAGSATTFQINSTGVKVDVVTEYTGALGVTIENVLAKDGQLYFSQYTPNILYAFMDDDSINMLFYIYADTAGEEYHNYIYRYGGSESVPTAAPSGADLYTVRGYTYDGSSNIDTATIRMTVNGAVATNDVPGKIELKIRGELIHMLLYGEVLYM